MDAEDERIWFELIERRSQEEERRRQTELRKDYAQLRGVYERSKEANAYFLRNLLELKRIYGKAHRDWDLMTTKAGNDIATSRRFLRATRYTSLRTKFRRIEINQDEIIDHIRTLAEIANYRMLFWLNHIGRFQEEELVLQIRSHFARRLRQRFAVKSDRTPIRLFADRLTSPFNHYVDSMADLEKDFRSLFSWNPPSPSGTRAADLPLFMSRLQADDADKFLRQSPPKVRDILKQSEALMSNAKSIRIAKTLEKRLTLSKLATRPLVEQYLYLRVDIPLRMFANTTYAMERECGKFENDMNSSFVKWGGRALRGYVQLLVDLLNG